jgi:hypothetical protein
VVDPVAEDFMAALDSSKAHMVMSDGEHVFPLLHDTNYLYVLHLLIRTHISYVLFIHIIS